MSQKRRQTLAELIAGVMIAALGACAPPGEGEREIDLGEGEGEGESAVFTPEPAAASLVLPWDAAPSADGTTIYYTALAVDGEGHALWSVPADASAAATELAAGFVLPLNIAVSSDGATIFVADAGHEDLSDEELDSGAIFAVPAAGGTPVEVAGTYGFRARGLDIQDEALVFAGTDPADGQRGVFRAQNGAVNALAKGAPFDDPSGVAVAQNGELYAIDTSNGEDGKGSVLRVGTDGAVSTVVGGLDVGMPAGCALTLDEGTLFVSGRDVEQQQAQVYVVGLGDGSVATVSTGLEGNAEAGGVHRARDIDEYAWAGTSTVYRIRFR